MAETNVPAFAETINQAYFIEPLSGPKNPVSLLDRFPEEVYDKTPYSHFMRFMYSLLGPAGVGWLAKNYLEARLKIVAHGFDTFDLERFYGNPFRFSRILAEQYDSDPLGLLTQEEWDVIKSQDESYRQRAIAYFNAARLGTTPKGMELAARSGLDHAVTVIENYKYLFDLHTDIPLDLPYYGSTTALEEFIVVPRREEQRSEVQTFTWEDTTIAAGSYNLSFRGRTTEAIAWDAETLEIQDALRALTTIGLRGVRVEGGPFPNDFTVYFQGPLSNQNVAQIVVFSNLRDRDGVAKDLIASTATSGVSSVDEEVGISDEPAHNMQDALDFLRPVNSLPTIASGTGTRSVQPWRKITGSSEYTEVIKFLTGSQEITWPVPGPYDWVEGGVEKQERKAQGTLQHHFMDFHTPSDIVAYTDAALDDPDYEDDIAAVAKYPSEHVGAFPPAQATILPMLGALTVAPATVFPAENALAGCVRPPEVTAMDANSNPLIGGSLNVNTVIDGGGQPVAPTTSGPLPGAWWSSAAQVPPLSDFLEIDFGAPQTVNVIEFNVSNKPVEIDIFYDLRGGHDERTYTAVEPWAGHPFPQLVAYNPHSSVPWTSFKILFKDRTGVNVYTRFLRIRFRRRSDVTFRDPTTNLLIPYTVDVAQMRLGHYANPGSSYPYAAHF